MTDPDQGGNRLGAIADCRCVAGRRTLAGARTVGNQQDAGLPDVRTYQLQRHSCPVRGRFTAVQDVELASANFYLNLGGFCVDKTMAG